MRLTIFIFFLALLQLSASSYSQNTRLNIKGNNLTLEEIFDMIEHQSEFSIFYNMNQLDLLKRHDINEENQQVEKILSDLLTGTDLTYTINNKLIVIHKQNEEPRAIDQQSKQGRQFSGKVTDRSGLPIPGVSVVVKGSKTGITTDNEGNFYLTLPADAISLIFSFIGMKSQEVIITNKTTINVVLEEETIALEEVVAIGYGTIKKRDLTGSVGSVGGS
ncbi:MAG: carboxypeptidase-like regulatory domain-containing protein, partial [Prolixibacteraceae bacterium]